MAKAIKRVGVMLLVVAIICLMAIGVILGVSNAKNGLNFNESLLDLDNKVNEANDIREDEIPPIDEEIFLDGTTCDEQAAKWAEAINKSLANGGGNHILVTMKKDWVAIDHSVYIKSFASNIDNLSVRYGGICIPANTIITLDLNGCTINKNLNQPVDNGNVIFIYGTLILKDSKYNSVEVQNAYHENPANSDIVQVAESLGAGKITGGNIEHSGGAFQILQSAKFYMYSGVISNNKAVVYGGAFYVCQQTSVKIYDGIIANNSAGAGGGIYLREDAKFNFYNGFMFNNRATTNSGGGIYCAYLTTPANIYAGVIAKNTALDDGGGILVGNSKLNMYGGIIDRNIARGVPSSCGGGICGLTATINISGAKITNNECGYLGGGVYNQTSPGKVTISDTFITGNKATGEEGVVVGVTHGGAIFCGSSDLSLGAGCLIYTNYAQSNLDNVCFSNPIEIYENLVGNGKAFRVALNPASSTILTSGLRAHKSSLTANQLFLADNNMTISENDAGEAIIGTTANTAQSITWKWGTGANQNALNYAEIPYTGQTYTMSAVVTGTSTAVSIRPAAGTSSLNIKEPGRYSFYTTGNYRASSFQIRILEPKEKVAKPTEPTDNAFIYGGVQQKFEPQGFDSSKMEISYNRATEPGQYTATVKLKDAWNTTWADGSTGALTYTYKIIRDSVIGANSEYDYVYKDNENKRQNYTENKIYHKYNDSDLNLVGGNPKYIIGNVATSTSVSDFITNLKSEDITKVKLFDSNGTLIYNGTTQSSSYDTSKTLVQTGWYLTYDNYYGNTETIYLSVLGDVVADGVINTLDITYISRIAKGEIKLDTLSIEQQLAAMVDNKGKVTSTDGKILLNVIGGNTELESYFENVAQKDKYQLLVLNNTSGKTFRQNINLTTLNVYDNAIIGNIAPKTKASDFKTKLATQTSANADDITIHKANGTIANDNDYIGTGYYINYNGKTIYLSVLGDLTGDGEINATDVTYLNRIISGNVKLNTNEIKDKLIMLSAIIQNKGNITTADSETLLNYIGGNADLTKYF